MTPRGGSYDVVVISAVVVLLKVTRGLRVPLSELLELAERRHRETYREPLGS